MHQNSLDQMEKFVNEYLLPYRGKSLRIADIGSQDVNGTYKKFFESEEKWTYVGIDVEEGKNVDIVLDDMYNWTQLDSESFDIVISGQTFEHAEYIWITIKEIARIMKSGGLGCIIAPAAGPEHRYPQDCWRIYPDGFRALAKYADLQALDINVDWNDTLPSGEANVWKDNVFIFKK